MPGTITAESAATESAVARPVRKRRRIFLVACLALVGAEATVVGLTYAGQRAWLYAHRRDMKALAGQPTAERIPGIDRPATRAADEAGLADDDVVLGLEVEGKFRAYRLRALVGKNEHIVNDVLGDRPVSVTYCDLRDCARGFTGGTPGAPLPLSQGGLHSGGMVLRHGEALYAQETLASTSTEKVSPPFPFTPHPLERVTWKVWRARHPESDVYVGNLEQGPATDHRPQT